MIDISAQYANACDQYDEACDQFENFYVPFAKSSENLRAARAKYDILRAQLSN